MLTRLRILHAIHDFLPRHQAGSEIYAFNLCRELASRHFVHVLAAEFDPSRRHGTLCWRVHEGIPVIELVNNWETASFADAWRSALIDRRLDQVLQATQPDVLHVHSLLNLSFNLPALAQAHGIPVVATLHDHTLVCPAGGQRLHVTEGTVCDRIDPDRCASCFARSPFQAQMSAAAVGRLAGLAGGRLIEAARLVARRVPRLAAALARGKVARRVAPVLASEVGERLAAVARVFEAVDLFVAPSKAVAQAHQQLGLTAEKVVVSDYGFPVATLRNEPGRPFNGTAGFVPYNGGTGSLPRDSGAALQRCSQEPRHPVRIGFVGTLVHHKGPHLLLEAARYWPGGLFEIEIHGSLNTFPGYSLQLTESADGLPVRFCGAFEPSRSASIYGRFDLLVVPSLWPENSPLVIHEAFLAGVPVAAAATGGIPELITDGVNGVLFEPGSARSLADAVRPLIEDPARLRRLASARPAVKSIEADAREWEQRYEALVSGRRA